MLESDMRPDFGQSETSVNPVFRFFRIASAAEPADNSEMGKKISNIEKEEPRKRRWYAAEWLARRKMSQTKLAKLTGFSNSQISEWINGPTRFNADVLERIADALEIKPFQLLLPPTKATDELMRVARLGEKEAERALKLLVAAEILPPKDETP